MPTSRHIGAPAQKSRPGLTRMLSKCILSACLFLLLAAACAAPPPLTVVLLPGTTLDDWRKADAPTLHQLMASGALALMNTRTARVASERVRETPDSALLTLGAGSRAAGSDIRFFPHSAIVPDIGVPAAELYRRRMGHLPPPNAWVSPDWPRALHDNMGRGYDIPLGSLGDALQGAGTPIDAQGSFARLLLASSNGIVRNSPAPALRVWDMGRDLVRADHLLHLVVLSTRAKDGQLIVLSPFVDDSAYRRGERLAPVVWWGASSPAGLLYSPSTRQAGLVLNTDFAPTVATYFGTRLPVPAFGRAWTMQADGDAVLAVSQLQAGAYRQAALLRLLPYCALLLGLSLLLGAVTGRRGLAFVPVVLILTLAVSTSWYSLVLWTVSFSLLTILGRRRLGTARTIFVGTGLLAAVLIGDMVTGSRLMHAGMLGYSAIEGARFYGLGNEAMGALVGSMLVVTARMGRSGGRPKRLLTVCVLLGVVLLLGTAGAKAGGVLVGGASFAVLIWMLSGRGISGRLVLTATAGALLILLLLTGLDNITGSHSHFGQALSRITGNGSSELWDIISRKVLTETRLLWHSAWAVPLWASVLVLWRKKSGEPLWAAGSVAVVLCLMFNDAGVVAGALCGSLVWAGITAERITAERMKKARVPQKEELSAGHGP